MYYKHRMEFFRLMCTKRSLFMIQRRKETIGLNQGTTRKKNLIKKGKHYLSKLTQCQCNISFLFKIQFSFGLLMHIPRKNILSPDELEIAFFLIIRSKAKMHTNDKSFDFI